MAATLHIIPFSHFNEKGMWILDYKGFEYRTEVLRDPTRRGSLARRSGGATTTPQLHTGRGTPINAAMVTPERPLRPIQRWITEAGIRTCRKPATSRPKSRKGAASTRVRRVSARMAMKSSVTDRLEWIVSGARFRRLPQAGRRS